MTTAQIETLIENLEYATPDQLVEAETLIKTELAQSSPADFALVASRGRWLMSPHLHLINQAVLDTIHGKSEPMLIIEAPPRHGKSMLISQYLPAWYLGRYPDNRVILTTYGEQLACDMSRKSRDILLEYGRQIFGVSISKNEASATHWGIHRQQGGMVAAGIGGPLTGRGGNLIVIDDYLKNDVEAQSQLVRDRQWDWWQSTASTRLEPGGVVVIIATRWHKDDLIGRLLRESDDGEGIPIRHIRLPAMANEDDPLGREPGDALWPERWPLERRDDQGRLVNCLAAIKQRLDAYWWQALYQQNPSQHGRAEFPPGYFHDGIWLDEYEWPAKFEAGAIAVDPSKGKNQKKGDYSAIVFVGLVDGRLHVDASISRRPPDQIVTDGILAFKQFKPDVFGIEDAMFQDLFKPIFDQRCKDVGIPPLPIVMLDHRTKTRTDRGKSKGKQVPKELRIGRLGPYLANDKLRFARSSGCRLLIDQLKEFPLGDYDDGPDALEMAIRLLNELTRERPHYDDHVYEVAVT